MEGLFVKRQIYGYDQYEPAYDSIKYQDQQIYPVNLSFQTDIHTAEQISKLAKTAVLDYITCFSYEKNTGAGVLAFGSEEDAAEFTKSFDISFQLLETRDQVNEFSAKFCCYRV